MRGHALARLGPVVAALVCAAPAAGETLGEALRARGARVTAETVPDAGISITSYTVLRDRQAFLIVYYRDQGTSALGSPLFVGRLDRVTGRWAQAAIDEQAIRPARPRPAWATRRGAGREADGGSLRLPAPRRARAARGARDPLRRGAASLRGYPAQAIRRAGYARPHLRSLTRRLLRYTWPGRGPSS